MSPADGRPDETPIGRSLDAARSRAVVVGVARYARDAENFPALSPVTRSALAVRDALCDARLVGLGSGQVDVLIDPLIPGSVLTSVSRAAREAEDTLLVYLAGHGVVSPHSGRWLLAVGDTTFDECDFTAVDFELLRVAISRSRARKRILLVDSCFSGRIVPMMSATAGVVSQAIRIQGTFAIASAPANSPALAPADAEHTVFTGEVLRVLRDGLANGHAYLTLGDVHMEVREALVTRGLPEPQAYADPRMMHFQLAPNAAFRPAAPDAVERTGDPDGGRADVTATPTPDQSPPVPPAPTSGVLVARDPPRVVRWVRSLLSRPATPFDAARWERDARQRLFDLNPLMIRRKMRVADVAAVTMRVRDTIRLLERDLEGHSARLEHARALGMAETASAIETTRASLVARLDALRQECATREGQERTARADLVHLTGRLRRLGDAIAACERDRGADRAGALSPAAREALARRRDEVDAELRRLAAELEAGRD